MKTITKSIRLIILVVFVSTIFIHSGKAQTTLFTEDWETAGLGQTPPTGWSTELVSGSNYTNFVSAGTHPTCSPFSGSRMVEFQSYNAQIGTVNRLKRTVPISTSGYPYVFVDFEWYQDTGYFGYTDHIDVQWSTSGATWTTASTIYRSSNQNAWVLQSIALPAGAANQATLYIALLFSSDFGDNCHLDLLHIKGNSTSYIAPTVITHHATNIQPNAATLNGSVNPNGSSTTGYFEYGTTTSYGSVNNFSGALTGNTLTPVSVNIANLSFATTYHFRLVGMNAGGVNYGSDSVFTTLNAPTVITQAATSITTNSAFLNGQVNANGSNTTVTFQYGLTTSYGSTLTYGTVTGNTLTNVSKQATGLSPSTTYHFRCVGATSYDTTYGYDTSFMTSGSPPTVITEPATSITTNSAYLNGQVNANGSTTTVTFQYGLTTSYGTTLTYGVIGGSSLTNVTKQATCLSPSTTYHFRCVGVNSYGTTNGNDSTFTTLPSGSPPVVITQAASNITFNSAKLNGEVNANGSTTTVTFQYGLTATYGSTITYGTVNGTSLTPIYYSVYGLLPATLYHYRCVGTNSFGTTYGYDTTFTTSSTAPTVTTGAATNINYTTATLNGTANANGLTTTLSFQYGLTTSYGSTAAGVPGTITGDTTMNITANITGLSSATLYHFRIKGINSDGTTYGYDTTFTTLNPSVSPPTVTTTYTSNISTGHAIMHGMVNANGSSTTTHFDYGISSSYGSTISSGTVSGSANTPIAATIIGLSTATLYHYRAVGTNAGGTSYGADSIFYTNDTVPTVVTLNATNVSSTGATLNGTINPNGLITSTSFEYGLTTGYGSTVVGVPPTVSGTSTQNVTYILTGLQPGTTYHYRAKGVNALGTGYGFDKTFTTSAGSGCHAMMTWSVAGPLEIQFHDISTGEGTYRIWYFGDGSISTLSDPLHTYTLAGNYLVSLSFFNDSTYCYDSTAQTIIVSDSTIACQAQYSYIPDPSDPNTLYFTDQSTGSISHWLWNFDDDSSSVAQNPVHTFPGPGNYYVCLAINGSDCISTICKEISVGGSTNCTSYFTFTTSGLTIDFLGHIYNGYPATYNWAFGDGQTGTGQNVSHTYTTSGAYYVTLNTVDSTNCSYTTGQSILAGDSAHYNQVYGQVFESGLPLTNGVVMLFSVDTIPPYMPLISLCHLDTNGVYIFPLVPEGDFYIYAIPTILNGYLPTYYGDVLNWENATIVHLGQSINPYNINLITAGSMIDGNGNIYGQMNGTGFKSDFLDKVTMLLMNSNGTPISFNPVKSAGGFSFTSLDYGTYYLRAEIAGVYSELVKVTLTPEHPNANVSMTFSNNRITGINNLAKGITSCIIYPNPVNENVNISFKSIEKMTLTFEIVSITGDVLLQTQKDVNPGSTLIPLPTISLNSGIYTLRISSNEGFTLTKKLVTIH